MSLKHPSILKRNYLIGKSYAKKEISAATFVTAKTFTLFMDADLAKVDNQHEKILAADVEDLEEYVREELFELSDEFGDNKEGYDEHLASIYGIGDGKYYQNIVDYIEDFDWAYVYKVVVGLGWKIIREDYFGSCKYINELYEPEVK